MKTFVSSTYVDLVSHRKAAAEALERLGHQVGRMEVFGARPEEPATACLTEIEQCDLFVGIYAHRYGFIPNGWNISITEAEFNHAKSNRKPMFCFVVNEDHPWPPKMIEGEPGSSMLRTFKTKLGTDFVRDTFTTCDDLAYKVAASLGRHLSQASTFSPILGTQSLSHQTNAQYFEKILSELANLRLEVQGKRELLQKLDHVDSLLEAKEQIDPELQILSERNPANFMGWWRDSITNSTLYATFLGDELVAPYSYGGNFGLTGFFYDFRRRSDNTFFARYKWVNLPISGFAYIQPAGPDRFAGGWWYSGDVPKGVLENLQSFNADLPRMNDLNLMRIRPPKGKTPWVDEFFSRQQVEFLQGLQVTLEE